MAWKDKMIHLLRKADDTIDGIKQDLGRKYRGGRPIALMAYRTYGEPGRVYLKGRALADKGITKARETDNLINNLLNMYRRFETDEMPGMTVRLEYKGEVHETLTDKEGYYRFEIVPATRIESNELYYKIPVELLNDEGEVIDREESEIMIPPSDAEFGIISDIDDTVIYSNATNLYKMARTMLVNNARTRLPFPGVAEFYKSLQLGKNGKRNNPFFYVSSSPWNLYDLLIDFLDFNKIPGGPLMLRDFGIQSDTFIKHDYLGHKFTAIKNILDTYPHLNFVLVGDSGERDPEIYAEVVKNFPERILAIYIRDVASAEKHEAALKHAEVVQSFGVNMLISKDGAAVARHAADAGLIYQEALPAIEEDKAKDEGQIPGKVPVGE